VPQKDKQGKERKKNSSTVRLNIDPPGKGQESASLEVKPARLALFYFFLKGKDYLKKYISNNTSLVKI